MIPRLELKRLPHSADLELPAYQSAEAAGLDLLAAVESGLPIRPMSRVLVPTGLAMALPSGFEGQVRPRSGLAAKHGITVLNTPGTIDADYRGEVKVVLINLGEETFVVERGMRIAQLVVAPVTQADIVEVETLSDTVRGGGRIRLNGNRREMNPGLVIFDCDGVLVDTETVANRVLAEILTDLGLPMDGTTCQRTFMGRTLESVKQMVEEMAGLTLPDNWPDTIRERDLEAFAKGIDPIPGVREVVDQLKARKIPFCVGSSGKYEKMRATLGSTGLLPLFEDVLYSAEDCENGKPAPDIFLLAAKGMGVDPAECVVIEDSLAGVMAARSAGMVVFGYVADPASDRAGMADAGAMLFDNMANLPKFLFS